MLNVLTMKIKNIAIICCRSGSKGIKLKNQKNFLGKPILFWLNQELRKSKLFHEIYLSSDSKKICNIGKNLGMVSDLRPKKYATSHTCVFDVHNYILNKFKINDKNFRICIVNNSPFLKSDHFIKTFKVFKQHKSKRVTMLVKKTDKENIYFRQARKIRNFLKPIFKKELIQSKSNRQTMQQTFVNIGDLRWGRKKPLCNYKNFNIEICNNGYAHVEVNESDYLDMNTERDWKLALKKFKN